MKIRKLTFKNPVRFFWQVGVVFGKERCVDVEGKCLCSFFGYRLWFVTLEFLPHSESTPFTIYDQGEMSQRGKPK